MKKIISALLSVAMLSTLTTSVFAAKHGNKLGSDPEATVTIEVTGYNASTNKATLELKLGANVCTATEDADVWDSEECNGFSNVSSYDAITVYYLLNSNDMVSAASLTKMATAAGGTKQSTNGRNLVYTTILSAYQDQPVLAFTMGAMDSTMRYLPEMDACAIKGTITLTESFAKDMSLEKLQEMFAKNELGKVVFASATIDTYGTYNDDEVYANETCISTVESDADYMWKAITPAPTAAPAGPIVPEYKTSKVAEIMETKAATYNSTPTTTDTGKGLYWLINFAQDSTDAYITGDIVRYTTDEVPVKQQSIAIQLDNGEDTCFRGTGNRAAYIFMENVPEGKYKGTFYIGATPKPAEGKKLFADEKFIEVK